MMDCVRLKYANRRLCITRIYFQESVPRLWMLSLVEPRGAQNSDIDNRFVNVRFLSAPWLHQGQHPADWNTLMIGRDLRHIRLAAMADRVLDSAVVLLDQPSPSCGGLAPNANPNVNPNDAGSLSVS